MMASNPCMQGGPSAGGWAARWSAADHRQVFGRGGNDTIAFIFVRSANKKQPLSWLSSVAHAMALAPIGSAVHLVQKRPLTHADAACVRSLDNIGTIRVHDMPSDDTEAGPSGGRECSGYLFWLLRNWQSLPSQMFFMHESPPDALSPSTMLAALASPRGFVNLLSPNAAVLRCFEPRVTAEATQAAGHTAGSGAATQGGSTSSRQQQIKPRRHRILAARTHYELPSSLHELLGALRIPPPRCVITPCCAEFRLRRDAAYRHRSRTDLALIDAYVRHRGGAGVVTDTEGGSGGGGGISGDRPRATAQPLAAGAASSGSAAAGVLPGWPPTRCHAMEHAWHLIFGEPSVLSPLPPRILRAGKSMRCCRLQERREGRPDVAGRGESGADECSLGVCPRYTHLPCSTARRVASEGSLGASNSMALHIVRALLRGDSQCVLDGATRGSATRGRGAGRGGGTDDAAQTDSGGDDALIAPQCGGGSLLGGAHRAVLAHVWNGTRSPHGSPMGSPGPAEIGELLRVLSPRTSPSAAGGPLSCTINV